MAEDCEHGSWVYRCPVCARSEEAITRLTAERDSAQRAAAILEERSWYEWGRAEQAESERDAAITRAEEAERLAVWAVRHGASEGYDGNSWPCIWYSSTALVRGVLLAREACIEIDGTDESILRALGEAAAMEGGRDGVR